MKKTFSFRIISAWILVSFLTTGVVPSGAYAQALNLPAPGTMVSLTPAYMPVLMKGVRVHPENPLLFDFILDSGKSTLKIESPEFKAESQKLIKYFLASLTIKEDDLWVNLSPYEKDRMITDELGKTELGRDMLAQDYILKQLTASLIYPEKDLGKAFWDRVYTKAREQFGTTDIPVDTFNKVWITADKAKVLERNNVAYVVGAHLKVMLDVDYTAAMQADTRSATTTKNANITGVGEDLVSSRDAIARQVLREVVIPEIEKEVNEGQNFAMLRQMFYSMILASWYKLALKDVLLNQVYSNKGKTGGVLADDPAVKDKIYRQYLEAYKKGVFNYIKEDMDAVSQQSMPRKYFSGGLHVDAAQILVTEKRPSLDEKIQVDGAMALGSVKMKVDYDAGQGNKDADPAAVSEVADQEKITDPFEINKRVDMMNVALKSFIDPETIGDFYLKLRELREYALIMKSIVRPQVTGMEARSEYLNKVQENVKASITTLENKLAVVIKADVDALKKELSVETLSEERRSAIGKVLKEYKDIVENLPRRSPQTKEEWKKVSLERVGKISQYYDITDLQPLQDEIAIVLAFINSLPIEKMPQDVLTGSSVKETSSFMARRIRINPKLLELLWVSPEKSRKVIEFKGVKLTLGTWLYVLEKISSAVSENKLSFFWPITLTAEGRDENGERKAGDVKAVAEKMAADIGGLRASLAKEFFSESSRGFSTFTGFTVKLRAKFGLKARTYLFDKEEKIQEWLWDAVKKMEDDVPEFKGKILDAAQRGENVNAAKELTPDVALQKMRSADYDGVLNDLEGLTGGNAEALKAYSSIVWAHGNADDFLDFLASQRGKEQGAKRRLVLEAVFGTILSSKFSVTAKHRSHDHLRLVGCVLDGVRTHELFSDTKYVFKGSREDAEQVRKLLERILKEVGGLDVTDSVSKESFIVTLKLNRRIRVLQKVPGLRFYQYEIKEKIIETLTNRIVGIVAFFPELKGALDEISIGVPEEPALHPKMPRVILSTHRAEILPGAEARDQAMNSSLVARHLLLYSVLVMGTILSGCTRQSPEQVRHKHRVVSKFSGESADQVALKRMSKFHRARLRIAEMELSRLIKLMAMYQQRLEVAKDKGPIYNQIGLLAKRESKLMERISYSKTHLDRVKFLQENPWLLRLIPESKRKKDIKSTPVGGIDLNAKKMDLDVAKDGNGVEMQFDPAMVAEFQKGDFTGVEGVILNIIPIASPLPLLGLEANPEENLLAKG